MELKYGDNWYVCPKDKKAVLSQGIEATQKLMDVLTPIARELYHTSGESKK